MNKIYSILTCIFGEYECLREAPKNDNIEYVCVTDNPNLKSDTWKIIIDEDLKDMNSETASFYVRYHPFKYCTGDICIRVDGSIQINKSLLPIFEEFERSDKDVCVMTNSRALNIQMELFFWIQGSLREIIKKQKELYNSLGVDIRSMGVIQSPISITRNTKICNDCDALCWKMIEELSTEDRCARPTQVIMTVALHLTEGLKIMFVDESLIQSDIMQWKHHNSDKRRYSLGIMKHKEFFGKPIEIYSFSDVHYIPNFIW